MVNLQDLLSPQKAIRPFLERFRKNREELFPIAVEIHWTSACNYNCIHCSYACRRSTARKRMLFQEVTKQLIDDLIQMEVKAVYLSGGGEPTVYPNWAQYAEKLVLSKIEVALITNGVLLEKYLELIRNFNYVAISIYSTKKVEYEKITGGKHFEKQFSLPEKIKSSFYKCIVGARCVINSINYKNILNIYLEAIKSGYDYIIFIPAVDYEKGRISLNREQKDYLIRLCKDNLSLINPQNTNLLKLIERGFDYYPEEDYRKNMFDYNKCLMIDIRSNAFINFDGNVFLRQPDIGNLDLSIGDLNKNRLKEIWNSPRHLSVLEKLHKRYRNGKCRYCRAIAFNKAIDDYLSPERFLKDYFL
jgi:MoaA/NifB/PqqE/SkfB family radical SAM enzyme